MTNEQSAQPVHTEMLGQRSEEDIDRLKANWESDPCWDIEDTEGFEAHRVELESYRIQKEKGWELENLRRDKTRCENYGCSPRMLSVIDVLRRDIRNLEKRLDEIQGYS